MPQRLSPTCLACAPRRGSPVSAAVAGCVEQQEREELSRVLAGQVGEDIRKERNTDPLSVTSCHVCEMALTFFWYLFTEDQCQTGHGRGDGGWGCQRLTIFVKWDTTGVERLSEDLGRRLTCLLPQPCPVPSGLWREATLQGTRRARRGALPAGSAAVASAHQRQLGVVVRRKCFQTIPAGGGRKAKNWQFSFLFSYCLPAGCREIPLRCFANVLLYH